MIAGTDVRYVNTATRGARSEFSLFFSLLLLLVLPPSGVWVLTGIWHRVSVVAAFARTLDDSGLGRWIRGHSDRRSRVRVATVAAAIDTASAQRMGGLMRFGIIVADAVAAVARALGGRRARHQIRGPAIRGVESELLLYLLLLMRSIWPPRRAWTTSRDLPLFRCCCGWPGPWWQEGRPLNAWAQ